MTVKTESLRSRWKRLSEAPDDARTSVLCDILDDIRFSHIDAWFMKYLQRKIIRRMPACDTIWLAYFPLLSIFTCYYRIDIRLAKVIRIYEDLFTRYNYQSYCGLLRRSVSLKVLLIESIGTGIAYVRKMLFLLGSTISVYANEILTKMYIFINFIWNMFIIKPKSN